MSESGAPCGSTDITEHRVPDRDPDDHGDQRGELIGFSVSYVSPEGWAVVDEREIWITLNVGEERIVLAFVQRADPDPSMRR